MLVLLFKRNVWCIPYEVLRYLFLSVLLIPIINSVTHGNDVSPLSFGIARIWDTMIGIVISLTINQLPIRRTTGSRIWAKGKRVLSIIRRWLVRLIGKARKN